MTTAEPAPDGAQTPDSPVVLYRTEGPVAVITLNRPEYRNAQNSAMTYALDSAFYRAAGDDDVKVIVLGGAGRHFSAGHDIGTPGRDIHQSFDRRAGLWWDHVNKEGEESRYARESEVYLGMCRRWRELPKPTIAMVHGACIAGGLMLAWCCDLIVAADDAFFADPVVKMGIPGVEYFAHPFVMGPRFAKEFLFTADRVDAGRACSSAWSTTWCRGTHSRPRRWRSPSGSRRCRASALPWPRRRSTRSRTSWDSRPAWTPCSACTTSRTPTTPKWAVTHWAARPSSP